MPQRTVGKPPFEPEVGESFHLIQDGQWPSESQQGLASKDCIVIKTVHSGSNGYITAKSVDGAFTGNFVGWEHRNTMINWHERCPHFIREAGAVSCTACNNGKPITPNKEHQMQIGSGCNTLWAGTLRVKGGHVPVVYNGDPDDGTDDSEIFWQGDLNKPYQNDPKVDGKAPDGWEAGYTKAHNVAVEVIKTFLQDGIEAAAKKVVK